MDGNGSFSALTDGILIARFLFGGFTGSSLTDGALGTGATRTDPAVIETYLELIEHLMLDVDDNGVMSALNDGILIARFLFGGFTGSGLTDGALGPNAKRTDPAEIIAFLNQFKPT